MPITIYLYIKDTPNTNRRCRKRRQTDGCPIEAQRGSVLTERPTGGLFRGTIFGDFSGPRRRSANTGRDDDYSGGRIRSSTLGSSMFAKPNHTKTKEEWKLWTRRPSHQIIDDDWWWWLKKRSQASHCCGTAVWKVSHNDQFFFK